MLTLLRLHEAATLLTNSPMLVKDVAAAVGYRDISNFVRAFARSYGQTPALYRAANRSERLPQLTAAASAEQK
jgi:transcriptional regulator GlxA family with amidase domain